MEANKIFNRINNKAKLLKLGLSQDEIDEL